MLASFFVLFVASLLKVGLEKCRMILAYFKGVA